MITLNVITRKGSFFFEEFYLRYSLIRLHFGEVANSIRFSWCTSGSRLSQLALENLEDHL